MPNIANITNGKAYPMTLGVLGHDIVTFHYDGSVHLDMEALGKVREAIAGADFTAIMWLNFIMNLTEHLPAVTKEQSIAKAEADFLRISGDLKKFLD